MLRPRLEDTPEVPEVKKVAPVKQEEDHVKSDRMDLFFAWKKKYGSTSFAIPPATGRNSKDPEYVGINGNRFYIDRGVSIDMPMNIAEMLSEKYEIQLNLGRNIEGNDMRVDGNFAKMSALS